jgi:hypothetical protein
LLAGFDDLRTAFQNAGIRYAVGGSWASTAFGNARFTNDVDIVAELTAENLPDFLAGLPEAFYRDADEALRSISRGRPFNVIHIPTALKFGLFPAGAYPLGPQELDLAVSLENSGLSKGPTAFVTPEDILLAKLHWFRLGGHISEVQWRDIEGLVQGSGPAALDRAYLEEGARKLGIRDLLTKALAETG